MTNGIGLYEIHITCHKTERILAAAVALRNGWKTSQIDGDPQLGQGVYFYLTKYASNEQQAMDMLDRCVTALRDYRVTVLREKIELIVHDVRHPT